MDIAIIGAGPVGCYAGYLLAKSGHKISIYENHTQIGSPVQCTGILTKDFDQFDIPVDKFLVNTINKIEVHSPYQKKFSIKQKDYIVCRKKFDNYFADLAKQEGCRIFLNHSFIARDGPELIIMNNKKELRIKPDIVIAADGSLSPTAKAYCFYHPSRKNYYGIQAVVQGEFAEDTTKTYFGSAKNPGSFIWVVPESKTKARVGLFTTKNSKHLFDRFITENKFKIIEMQAGVIPIFNPKQKLKKKNCYLIGDASSFVKATTGGGIIPGMKQAEILADCITNGKDFDQEVGKLRRKMQLHLRISKIIRKFSDDDWERLVTYLDHYSIKDIFAQHTRDNPVPLLIKTILTEPRLLYLLKYLI